MIRTSLLVVLAATFMGTTAHAQLAVDLQCWQGATESTVLPRLTFDRVAKPHGCKILVSNNTSSTLSNVQFHLRFGQHPAVPLTANPALGNQDPGAYFSCPTQPPTGSTFRPNMVLNVATVFPGFPSGTQTTGRSDPYGKRCFDYNLTPAADWTLPTIGAGETATLRVEFRSGFLLQGATFSTALDLTVTNLPGGVTAPSPSVPVDVAIPLQALEAQANYTPIQSPAMSMAGTLQVGTTLSVIRGAHSGMEVDFFLPYLRNDGGSYSYAIDGDYDAGRGDKLLFVASDLELNTAYSEFSDVHAARFRDAFTGEDAITAGGLAFPFNKLDDDSYHLDFGHLSGNAGDLGTRRIVVSYAAAYSQDPVVQAYLAGRSAVVTGKLCGQSDQSAEVCAQVNANLYTEGVALGHLYGQIDWTSFNDTAEREGTAATPFTQLMTYLAPPMLPWRNGHLTIVTQLPTNSAGQRGEAIMVNKTSGFFAPQPCVGSYSVAATDTSHEDNLLLRTVPSSSSGDWVSVGQLIYNGAPLPPTTTEVRVECSPSRYGVRNFGARNECDPLVTWKVPRNARPSINNSTFVQTNMTLASLGATARVTMSDASSVRVDARHGFPIEVDGGSRYSLNLIHDTVQQDWYARQRWAPNNDDRTTGQYASVGCVFANLGLDNVRAPLTLTVDWPVGWIPTSLSGDAIDAVHPFYGNATLALQGSNWGAANGTPVPEGSYAIDIDTDLRRIVVTFAGPLASGMFPGQDQVSGPLDYSDARWVGFRMDGLHLPGVTRFPMWTCKVELAESLAPDGQTLFNAVRALPPDAPNRMLGAPAPVLGGSPDPEIVPTHTSWTTTIDLRNPAYDITGQRVPNGAALSARDSVVYFRIPLDGDIAPQLQNGPLSVAFTSARSGDGGAIYVSTSDAPTYPTANALPAPGWVLCTTDADCDADALAGLGLAPGAVRWVAFAKGEVDVTDAEPRGVAPIDGATRVENPYLDYVTMTDVASGDGVLVRPAAHFVSSDTLLLITPEPDLYDVHIVAGCEACDDSNMCTTDVCDPDTHQCVYAPVTCGDSSGLFIPVQDANGVTVGAVRCSVVAGTLDCVVGADTDGDGRPNLVIYPELRNACGDSD